MLALQSETVQRSMKHGANKFLKIAVGLDQCLTESTKAFLGEEAPPVTILSCQGPPT